MSSTPWIKFYPRDWRGDQALRAVSIAARGLWMEMLCIMHEASPYGHLVLGGHAVSNDVLARMSGAGVDEVSALLVELENAGVLSRTRKGVIYSRRLVKDKRRSEDGRKAVSKRYSQDAEKTEEKRSPSRGASSKPTTQKPEARNQNNPPTPQEGGEERVIIPEWVPAEPWAGFVEMRKGMKKPLTARATKLAVAKLAELKAEGHSPGAVLDQSVMQGWQGLFGLSGGARGGQASSSSDFLQHKIAERKQREEWERRRGAGR